MAKIPLFIKKKIEKIEELISQNKIKTKRKIAVFDLDNTLLIGDIGEAVFASLKNDEQNGPLTIQQKKIPFSWPEYHNLLKKNKKKLAYKKMVTAMSGIPLKTLVNTTREILNSNKKYLQLEDAQIPIPLPNKIMQSVINLLKSLEYEISIISASNHFSVQIVARELFFIPESNVFGIKSKLKYHKNIRSEKGEQVLTSKLEKPVSVDRGKIEVYHKWFGSIPPLITAGDSETDISMLNLVDKTGLSIWVGNDQTKYESIKKKMKYPKTLYSLNRPIF